MDPEAARTQHDALADAYRDAGVDVHLIDPTRRDRPNAVFVRDNVLMTPEGAVVGRQAMACRRGEERFVAQALAALGVPILATVSGTGVFETACCLWVEQEAVVVGQGNRANAEGVRQVEEVLRRVGVRDFIPLQIPYGWAHIDSIVSFVDRDLALVHPAVVPWDVVTALRRRGVRVVEAPSVEEAQDLALNCVALEPGRVLMASGYPATARTLRDHGIDVVEIDISELLKGWGSIHCMTGVLRRDPVGRGTESDPVDHGTETDPAGRGKERPE